LLRLKRGDIRKCVLRMGMVLGKEGGVYPLVRKFFSWYLCFGIASRDPLPFIHVRDMTDCFEFILNNKEVNGIINLVSPEEVEITEFYDVLARSLRRKIIFRLPVSWIRFFMGESSVLLVDGQHVIPEKLLKHGFRFKYAEIRKALADLV